jgi:hypothetical protein
MKLLSDTAIAGRVTRLLLLILLFEGWCLGMGEGVLSFFGDLSLLLWGLGVVVNHPSSLSEPLGFAPVLLGKY